VDRLSAHDRNLHEALAFAEQGKVKAHVHRTSLENINDVFAALKRGHVDGRMVLEMAAH
jgi:propanol-preferring alcohol dehydrogenase